MGTELGSTCGALGSAETASGTHVLDPGQNIIEKGALLKNAMNGKWLS
jgi:hypothetical protein